MPPPVPRSRRFPTAPRMGGEERHPAQEGIKDELKIRRCDRVKPATQTDNRSAEIIWKASTFPHRPTKFISKARRNEHRAAAVHRPFIDDIPHDFVLEHTLPMRVPRGHATAAMCRSFQHKAVRQRWRWVVPGIAVVESVS